MATTHIHIIIYTDTDILTYSSTVLQNRFFHILMGLKDQMWYVHINMAHATQSQKSPRESQTDREEMRKRIENGWCGQHEPPLNMGW